MNKIPEIGDLLKIDMDGTSVVIMKHGGCLAEEIAGFGKDIPEALRSLAIEIEYYSIQETKEKADEKGN